MIALSRRRFSILFVLLAVCFVPILISFGVVAWIVPTGWGLAAAIKALARLAWRPGLGFAVYSIFYSSVFYLVARILHFLIGRLRHDRAIKTVQVFVLAALFGCSFIRVITYSSIQGRGGTYTFWTAVERCFDRRSR